MHGLLPVIEHFHSDLHIYLYKMASDCRCNVDVANTTIGNWYDNI